VTSAVLGVFDGRPIELGNGPGDSTVTEFNTYEDSLDSQITPMDLYYLEVLFA